MEDDLSNEGRARPRSQNWTWVPKSGVDPIVLPEVPDARLMAQDSSKNQSRIKLKRQNGKLKQQRSKKIEPFKGNCYRCGVYGHTAFHCESLVDKYESKISVIPTSDVYSKRFESDYDEDLSNSFAEVKKSRDPLHIVIDPIKAEPRKKLDFVLDDALLSYTDWRTVHFVDPLQTLQSQILNKIVSHPLRVMGAGLIVNNLHIIFNVLRVLYWFYKFSNFEKAGLVLQKTGFQFLFNWKRDLFVYLISHPLLSLIRYFFLNHTACFRMVTNATVSSDDLRNDVQVKGPRLHEKITECTVEIQESSYGLYLINNVSSFLGYDFLPIKTTKVNYELLAQMQSPHIYQPNADPKIRRERLVNFHRTYSSVNVNRYNGFKELDESTNTLYFALLLFMYRETQGNSFYQWFPHLNDPPNPGF
jgi:hypothetical protein